MWQNIASLATSPAAVAGACVLFLFLAVGTGRLVPRRIHQDALQRIDKLERALAAKDATVAERDRQIAIVVERFMREIEL